MIERIVGNPCRSVTCSSLGTMAYISGESVDSFIAASTVSQGVKMLCLVNLVMLHLEGLVSYSCYLGAVLDGAGD